MREERAVEAARRIMTGCEDPLEATIVARAYLALSGAAKQNNSVAAGAGPSDLLAIPNGELKNFRGYAPSVPPDDAREAAHEIISDLLSMCDASNWDADGYRDLEYSIRHEVYERLHDFAADWQQRIGALRAVERPADPRGWREPLDEVAGHADIALQDALYEDVIAGEKVWLYDADKFIASMRGNGYTITRSLSPAPKDREGTKDD